MDSTPHHLMYHLLAPGYDQVQWNTPYLDNTKAAIDSTNPVIALNSANTTTTVDGPIVQPPSSIYCPLPVKYEQPLQSYDDTGGYSITALGASAGPSAADQQQQLLYGAPTTGNNHPPDPQQLSMSALNFFTGQTGGAYPATPAALMGPLMNAAGGGDNPDSEQLNKQKELIYGHPLFPMLTVLFQKCELATCTPREPAKEGDQIDLMNVCSAASFTQDLEEFAKTVQMNKPYYLPNPELDSLMINAIQVLRYHLLELEKVHELCDNFCAKYVNKIKERTQMDIIAGEQPPPSSIDQPNPQSATPNRSQPATGMGSLSSPATSSSMEHQMQHYGTPGPHQQYAGQELMSQHQLSEQQSNSACPQQLGFLDAAAAASSAMGMNMNNAMMLEQQAAIQQFYAHQQQHQQQQMALNGASQLKQEMVSNGGGGGNARHAKRAKKSANTTAHIHAQPQPENHPSPDTTARTDSNGGSRSSTATAAAAVGEDTKNSIASNGMLSAATQITNAQQTATPQPQQQQQQNNLDALDETGGDDGLSFGDMSEERDSASPDSEHNKGHHRGENGSQKKKVPKVFSKEAISKFRAWLFNNITHPYPAEEQKKQLAAETGLTILQVNNWFINARRRIVQPMIDSNNRAGRPMSVFKNRRRKSSGGNGTTPSPQPDCQSPELANGTIANGSAEMLNTSSSPDESSTGANSAANNSGGSSSSTGGGANGLGIQPVVDPLLNFSAGSSMAVTNPYQAAAAVAAAVSSNPYANFGGAFPFSTAGMGGMSAMMPYGLNSMPGAGWSAMDLGGRSGMDR